MRKRWLFTAIMLVTAFAVLTGCGGKKTDIAVFVMTNSVPVDSAKMESALKEKVGESPTIGVQSSPMFSLDKLFVELAAGDNDLFVVPQEQFTAFAKQGGLVILDDLFKAADYPDGVVEAPVDTGKDKEQKLEKHLYGIPLNDTKWLKDAAGYRGKEQMYAFIHPRSKMIEQSKNILKIMAEK